MKTNEHKMIQTISITSCALVTLLALASFSLSFEALRQLAIKMKVVPESLAWVFPCVIDGAIVVFSMSALRAELRAESSLSQRGLVVFVTAVSVLLNICHVEANWLARLLAASPPSLLFLSFESLMHSIKNEMQHSWQNVETVPISEQTLSKAQRIDRVRELLDHGKSAQQIAEEIPAVSLRTIQRDMAKLDG